MQCGVWWFRVDCMTKQQQHEGLTQLPAHSSDHQSRALCDCSGVNSGGAVHCQPAVALHIGNASGSKNGLVGAQLNNSDGVTVTLQRLTITLTMHCCH